MRHAAPAFGRGLFRKDTTMKKFMKMKKSMIDYAFWTLLPLLFLVMLTGGCGGSSGGGTGSYAPVVGTTGQLEFDSDNDGIPDVFECAGLQEIDGTHGGTFSATVPFLLYSAGSAALTIDMELEAGVEYTLEFSHVLGQSLEAALPDLTLYAPDGREVAFDFGLSDSEREEAPTISDDTAKADDAPTLIVSADLTILPEEDPSVILFTFKAPSSGTWHLAASQQDLDATGKKIPWMLRGYKEMRGEDGSCGYPLRLTLGDTDFVVGQRELIDLRRVLLSYATEFNKMGFPTAMSDDFYRDEVFQNLIDAIIMEHEPAGRSAVSAGGVSIASSGAGIFTQVNNVPYDTTFGAGAGFYAHSGLLAPTQGALESFTMPTPENSSVTLDVNKETFTYTIDTLEELIRALDLGSMSTFALAMNALGQRPITSTNVRLGQTSKTLLFRIDVTESSPRLVNISSLKFSKSAKEALDEGSNAFREDYGDYFVSGYTWGARYDAVISVTSNNSSGLDEFCEKLKEAVKNAWNNQNYSSALSEVQRLVSRNEITLTGECIVIGGGKSQSPAVINSNNLESVLAGVKEFMNNVNGEYGIPRRFVPLRVSLTRFKEVAGGNVISERLPISKSHFDAVKDLTKSILLLRCYYNTMATVPLKNIINGQAKVDEWTNRFNERIGSIKVAIRKICDSESLLAQQKRDVDRLVKEFKDLTERYVFYRKLVVAQSQQSSGFSETDEKYDSVAEGGIEKYTASKTVLADYHKGGEELWCNQEFNKDAPFWSWHTWTRDHDGSGYGNWRNVWVRASSHKTNSSKSKDQRYPTVGKKGYKWYFEGGGTRRAEWYFKVQIAHMPEWKYPFVGL